MPFVSEAQRRWMHANHPEMAQRWEKHTPKGKSLPRRKKGGKRRAVANVRMRLAVNAFCPTGEGGGIDPTCSPSGATGAMIGRLQQKGGFTFVASERKYQDIGKKGYAVSPYPNRSAVFKGKVGKDDVRKFMKANKDLLSKEGHAVGAWRDPESGKTYLDVSIVTRSRSDAIRLGRKHNQISIFDFKRGTTISTGGSGEKTHNYLAVPGGNGRRDRDSVGSALQGLRVNAFCPTGEGGGIDATCSPGGSGGPSGGKAGKLLSLAKNLPAKMYAKVKAKVAEKYQKLEQRYGGKYAKAIIGAAILAAPVPIPGSSLVAAAPLIAMAEVHRYLTTNAAEEQEMSIEEIDRAARQLLRELEMLGKSLSPVPSSSLRKKGGKGRAVTSVRERLAVNEELTANSARYNSVALTPEMRRRYAKIRARMDHLVPTLADAQGLLLLYLLRDFKRSNLVTGLVTNKPPAIKDVADNLYEISDEYTRREAREIARIVKDGYGRGWSDDRVAREIEKRIDDVDRAEARRLAVTEGTRMEAQDVLSGAKGQVRFVCNPGCCSLCEALDGQVFSVADAGDVIPVHPNCECGWENVEGDVEDELGQVENAFCPTGPGGGVDPTCSPSESRGGGGGAGGDGPVYKPDVTADKDGDGVTDYARVGVKADEVPPPPGVGRLPNLTPHERAVEKAFIEHYESDPDKVANDFRKVIKDASKPGEPPTFGTDDAKVLADAWSHPNMEMRAENRATLNLALHQTANAIAKRAFLNELDTLKAGDEVLVTVGGCGSGKGFALKNVPDALAMKAASKVVWDSAGDQNATENPWIQREAEKRGLKVSYVYVHADPETQWAHPERGVVKRAGDPKDGRMVDAKVFADSYALGAKNHQAFYEKNKDNPNARFVFLENRGTPKRLDGIPKEALNIDRNRLAKFAVEKVREANVPERVKVGGTMGERIWQ